MMFAKHLSVESKQYLKHMLDTRPPGGPVLEAPNTWEPSSSWEFPPPPPPPARAPPPLPTAPPQLPRTSEPPASEPENTSQDKEKGSKTKPDPDSEKEEKKPDTALDYLISELYGEIERLKKQNKELERQVTELTVTAPARGSSARW